MMAGGLAALMLQSLHPLALAGVWDHSAFRTDTLGRLRNTTAFVNRTTYAPRATAEAAIERVLDIHHRVRGAWPPTGAPTAPTTRTCSTGFLRRMLELSAGLPDLLPGPHSAGAARPLSDGDGAHCRSAGRARGCRHRAPSWKAFFVAARPSWSLTTACARCCACCASCRCRLRCPASKRSVFIGAAAVLLPDWALDLMGRTPLQQLGDRAAARRPAGASPQHPRRRGRRRPGRRACRRTGADFEGLFRWD